jgi:Ca2+-binding EF-hand superfamily protein
MKAIAFVCVLGVLVLALAPPVPAARGDDADEVQDVLYVGPPYPVLLRLRLRSEAGSVFARWDGFMTKLFAHLDRNRSGGLDRVEAGRAPTVAQLQQFFAGNLLALAAGTAPRGNVPFEQLDADRDGKVTLDELKDYYRKNGAGPVSVPQPPAPAPVPGEAATPAAPAPAPAAVADILFDLLDTNKDGKLSKAELDAAERVLMKYDSDDNELVSLAELGVSAARPVMARVPVSKAMMKPAQAAPSTLLLVPRDDSGRRMTGKLALAREILARYDKDKDGKLSREEIGFPQAVFDRLDRNKDGYLDTLELLRWTKEKPAGEFTLQFGADASPAAQRGTRGAARRSGDGSRWSDGVTLEGVRISVVAHHTQIPSGAGQYLMTLFGQIAGKNDYIVRKDVDAREFAYLRALFDLADSNSDGRLTRKELKSYLDVLEDAPGRHVSLALTATGQGLFDALDANGDGQLSVREMRNAWARLAEFDRDGDGCISREEFPRQFRLTASDSPAARQAANAEQQGMVAGAGIAPPSRGPLWFRKMDRNGDGDVSRKEWLGSKEDFDRIDTDRDGLISVEEAEAFDALMRKKGE